ncbi:UDP-N-acetylglucosamine 1-carboxyvinyltransferase [Anaerotignum propionicum]|uniref:UDP-N-acetylglucosamine 1-carboxyvinyltransferase n=1 Tax=Anaerotignum propionicum DSM 1682 TaxID=991789 RepID=A0A110A6Y7_ANAPI|nr:UDP-N-acetylglucosamine 1-carboxyvinyltransferase [Anaerotignum propionicum]AMJ40408.1 UDP-N-acetylglucosamine 1-carboxyvinyltransferase 1 [Anaerotignum propionicum DSM 1682]SHE42956.1 UDP-N-acetylglucosamine 1-carboxyvinyltransferase [[Clostridium] propionicum DSM 1682] [Anaerotignum propionicum DSM 1682]
MGYYLIEGGKPISGEFAVRGSKNAALPILAATLLAEDEVVLENCPLIRDFYLTLDILRELGCRVELTGRTAVIDTRQIQDVKIREETVQKMRSSILFLGALLGRERKAILGHPGGCAIGERPIDIHLKAFEKMGVEIIEEDGLFYCEAPHILGYHIYLNYPSVGATENILLLAVKAEGVTVIHNAAREPEIVALVRFLRACGAEIYGEGTPSIMIEGVKKLHGAYFSIPFDRIEAGTFLCASAMTGGELYLTGIEKNDIETTLEALVKTGCQFNIEAERIWMKPPKELKSGFSLVTGPFPGFPTDMQPLMMSLLTLAKGTCMISETVFEARFRHADELCRMGADIVIEDRVAQIKGCGGLHGAEVFGRDLRGGAALLIAALAAEGKSTVYGSEYVERGYEKIEDALSLLGGNVRLME